MTRPGQKPQPKPQTWTQWAEGLQRRLQQQDFRLELQRQQIARLEHRLAELEPASPVKASSALHHSAAIRIERTS